MARMPDDFSIRITQNNGQNCKTVFSCCNSNSARVLMKELNDDSISVIYCSATLTYV